MFYRSPGGHTPTILSILLFLSLNFSLGQGVYERGTFVSFPAGKHVNHIYQGTWNTYFAVEDGVLVYDHHNEKWLPPITGSNGLVQYPALLVWQDPASMEVWIISPDYVFIFDHGTGFMQRGTLPMDKSFAGSYSLGISPDRILISASGADDGVAQSAVFFRNSGQFEAWGPDSLLEVNWDQVEYLHGYNSAKPLRDSYIADIVKGGVFGPDGLIRLDGYPQLSGAIVSSLVQQDLGQSFLGTQGLGVFLRDATGSQWVQMPFGLLSPDVMTLKIHENSLLVGNRTGLTQMEGMNAIYDESIAHAVYDYSFVSAIETTPRDLYIAGRGGVFKRKLKGGEWTRLASKDDLRSKQIYALSAGLDGNILIATEENGYVYNRSGLIMQSLFPKSSRWSVYDISYSQGNYYLATVFGLYVYNEEYNAFTARITSQGQIQSPQAEAALDPIYAVQVKDSLIWASSSRGLMQANLKTGQGTLHLSPESPFKPRGLVVQGGSVWVGTESGLHAFDIKKMAWRQYGPAEGLISNFITDLAAQGDYIWVGSNLGLTRITWKNLY